MITPTLPLRVKPFLPTQGSQPNTLRFSGHDIPFKTVQIPPGFMDFLTHFTDSKDHQVYTNLPADVAQQVEAAIRKIQRSRQGLRLINDPAFREQCHLYEETADTLFEACQLEAIDQNLLPRNPRVSESTVQHAFDQLLGVHGWGEKRLAKQLFQVLVEKFNHRQPWIAAQASCLQFYSTRAGDEVRELLEVLHLPDADDQKLRQQLHLLLADQNTVLADPSKLAQYVVAGQLTPQLKDQLDMAKDLARETARKNFGITDPNALLPYTLFKLKGRVSYESVLKQNGIQSPKGMMKPYEALFIASQLC